MKRTQRHKHILNDLYLYIEELKQKAIKEKKEFIIWGYAKGGAFIKWLLEAEDNNANVAYIIDDRCDLVIGGSPSMYRSTLFNYIDNKKYIVLSTILDFSLVQKTLDMYGYKKNDNLYDIRHEIGVSYIDFLQINNMEIDFGNTTANDRPDIYVGTDNSISTPFDTISVDEVFQTIKNLDKNVNLFDYGCGKGQILFDAYINGIDNLAGIELVEEIVIKARKNMEILGIPAVIYNEDATIFSDIDNYNVFFLNNPFVGNVFKSVISQIEDSVTRCPRNTFIVYLNPRCHTEIIKNGVFKMYEQKYIACGDPIMNIYVANGKS
ncbi:hypothetical protein [Pseudobutyrivibrio xylanivorans]|uniref:Uncharacterized protein n=1 Tax=Pseudobutyrivibrio xylanivorans TaxID=185007 RepID=A0A5P6VRP3_PSEXY|nr:hypothetical protein [Pseudobutyrivibrio xylanivorans]QFJ54988.1 hypothetical protein FXF36_09000 [Pseudobutyrivibrio xylanivorans]